MGQDADGREPDGTGAVGQGGPDGQERGDGKVHEGHMAVAGGSGGWHGAGVQDGGQTGARSVGWGMRQG